jgi:hypothetical protein
METTTPSKNGDAVDSAQPIIISVKNSACLHPFEYKGKNGPFEIALVNECKKTGGKSKKRLRRKKRSRKTRKRK